MKIIEKLPKIFLMTIIFIFVKNLLQIFFGIIINSPAQPFDTLNLINVFNFTKDSFEIYIFYFFLYEIIIFGGAFYLWMYVLLFFIISKFGNRITLQVLYLLLIYIFSVQIFNDEKVAFYPVLIVIILGILNWWLFKKWIK